PAIIFFFSATLRAAVDLPIADPSQPIAIRASGASHWKQGAYEVWVLRGSVQIVQGTTQAKGDEAVLWIDRAEAFSGRPSKIIAYLEGKEVRVDLGKPNAVNSALPAGPRQLV